MPIYSSITDTVGNTPLIALTRFSEQYGLKRPLVAKVEGCNPAGSAKDRIAVAMLRDAIERGVIKPGGLIVEPTSGNTGIGLAMAAAAWGYRVILTMPDTMSVERRNLLKAYGAQIVLTPGAQGMNGAIARAQELVAENEGAWIPGQFDNPANPHAHYLTTGPEIWRDTEGAVDVFVAGIGTGGTISGTGKYLKEQNPAVHIVGVEPAGSPLLTKGHGGSHAIQGIGAGFIPENLDRAMVDEIIDVENEAAFAAGRASVAQEGLLVGISSGAALHAAAQVAKRQEFSDKLIVVLLPDSGERYLSTAMFQDGQ